LIAATTMAALPAPALAAVDSFIWFDGEHGNSADARHKDWFEIKELSLGTENPAAVGSATSGAGAGKAKFKEFTIKRMTDSASPSFFRQAVSSGRHFPTVKIEMRKAGGDPHEYVNYVFTDVMISRVNMSGSGAQGPEESITLIYGSMTVHYTKQTAGGEQTAPAPIKGPPQPARAQPPAR
jgi:type VI secretion system secreted protein Hcp